MNYNSLRKFKHIAILVPAVAKSFHANADGLKKKKYDRTTMAIRNAGFSGNLKVIAINKIYGMLKVLWVQIPHSA